MPWLVLLWHKNSDLKNTPYCALVSPLEVAKLNHACAQT